MGVIHVDADCFFLAVHARDERSRYGASNLLEDPCALWQYDDIVCVSEPARALGVRKHMSPKAARVLLEPEGGRLVHAYWRQWPGPRTWYGPYQCASRELFRTLRTCLDTIAPRATLERASIDEGFIEVKRAGDALGEFPSGEFPSEEPLDADERLAEALAEALRRSGLGLPVSIGVGPNKMLAKLASGRAKKAARAAMNLSLIHI